MNNGTIGVGLLFVGLFLIVSGVLTYFGRGPLAYAMKHIQGRQCTHFKTRCLHGDEAWYYADYHPYRWWMAPVIHRQICVRCGKPLDREPICKYIPAQHTWYGDWPDWDQPGLWQNSLLRKEA